MATTVTTMKMALASDDDLSVAYDLLGLLGNVESDYYPADEDDEDAPTFLDVDDPQHLRFVYGKLKAILDRRGSGALHRVIGGFSTVRYAKNQILDLTKDVVELHPRILAALDPWIEKSASLPDKPGWYLVMLETNNDWGLMSDTPVQVEFGAFKDMPQSFTWCDSWHENNDITDVVTHWMPMPSAPARNEG